MKYSALVLFLFFFSCHLIKSPSYKYSEAQTGANQVKKHTLKNGMTVLILENPDSKVVTLDVWINTGSAFEPKDINGVSHFLEHMLFKGTEKRAVGEIDREIEAVGGLWNAGTSLEFTHYYLTVAAPYFQIGADALADVIANSKLESAEVERERQVILEEYHRQQDDPDNYLMTMVFWNSFESSPSRWPVLGTPDTINAITPERLRQYYHERYTPANMALVVVGGIKETEVMPVIEQKFGIINRPLSSAHVSDEKTQRREGVFEEYPKPVKEAYIIFNFPAPDLTDGYKDVYAMDLVAGILGDGRSSRLFDRIKEKKNLASSIAASFPTHRRDGSFIIFATFDYAKKDALIKAVLEEVRLIGSEKTGRAELEKAKRMFTNQYLFSHETTTGRASEIGYFYTLTGDTKFEENYLQKVQEVSAADIQKVAASWLAPEKANIFIVKPE